MAEEVSDLGVLKKLVFFSALLWLIPALLYVFSDKISERPQLFGYVAVVAVNAVVAVYIVQAFREKPRTAKAD